MARLMQAKRILALKIVYYGPGLSGKTTNLEKLHELFPAQDRGELLKLDTETERTLFFDYFPADLGTLSGFKLKADLFTVPGQSFYHSTRRVVLDGADGIVFVADSDPRREEANLHTYENMVDNLQSYGRGLEDVPLVMQWNKRDLKNAVPVSLLERMLNPTKAPSIEAAALDGTGVKETHDLMLKLVLQHLRQKARSKRASRKR